MNSDTAWNDNWDTQFENSVQYGMLLHDKFSSYTAIDSIYRMRLEGCDT